MRRTMILTSLLLLGVLVLTSYLLENRVETMRRHLAGLDADYLEAQRGIQVLKAEWSYLNEPERLQKLALRHVGRVGLQPISPGQIGGLDELPLRPPPPPAELGDDGIAMRDGMPWPSAKPPLPQGLILASTERKP